MLSAYRGLYIDCTPLSWSGKVTSVEVTQRHTNYQIDL